MTGLSGACSSDLTLARACVLLEVAPELGAAQRQLVLLVPLMG